MSVLNSFRLDNQVAIITGGAGLLGIKHAEAIREAGGIAILVDVDKGKLDALALTFETYYCDITQKMEIERLLQWVLDKFAQVNILINNAAINPKVEGIKGLEFSRFENYSLDVYEKEMSVGLTGAFLCTQVFGTHMAKSGGGVIVNIASDLGLIAPNQNLYKKDNVSEGAQPVKAVTYSIIKHGLIGLTRYTATYWADKGIRCNALAPGGVENGQDKIFLNRIKNLIPMGRMARENEYKAAIVFLASQASSYMNGAVVSIDGGRSCW